MARPFLISPALLLLGCASEPPASIAAVQATVAALQMAQLQRSTAQIGILPTTPTVTAVITPTDIPAPTAEPALEPTPTTVLATAVSPQEAKFRAAVTTWLSTVDSSQTELASLAAASNVATNPWLKRLDAVIARLELGVKQTAAMSAPASEKASEATTKNMAICVGTETAKVKKARDLLKPGALDPLKQAAAGLHACYQTGAPGK